MPSNTNTAKINNLTTITTVVKWLLGLLLVPALGWFIWSTKSINKNYTAIEVTKARLTASEEKEVTSINRLTKSISDLIKINKTLTDKHAEHLKTFADYKYQKEKEKLADMQLMVSFIKSMSPATPVAGYKTKDYILNPPNGFTLPPSKGAIDNRLMEQRVLVDGLTAERIK